MLCEKCEGFVSCENCWRLKRTMLWLIEKQTQRLLEDLPREHKLWSRLSEHDFEMDHADWTNPDLFHFAIYTFQQLFDLREREARFVAAEAQKAEEPPAQRQRNNSGQAVVPAAARSLPSTSHVVPASRFSASQPTLAASSAGTHALFRSTMRTGQSQGKTRTAATNQLSPSSLLFGPAKPTTVSHVHLALAPAAAPASSSSSALVRANVGKRTAAAASGDGFKQTTLLPQPILAKASPLGAAASSSITPIDLTGAPAAAASASPSRGFLSVAPSSTTPFPPTWVSLMAFYARNPVDSSALEVRASQHVAQPLNTRCELGVFVTRRIPKDQVVCYYAAHRVIDKKVDRRLDSHVRHLANSCSSSLDGLPTARLFRRYLARSEAEVQQLLAMPAADFLPLPGTLAAQQLAGLPLGCMINSPVRDTPHRQPVKANVATAHIQSVSQADDIELVEVLQIVAKCDIEAGTELLCRYAGHLDREKQKIAPLVLD